MGVRHRTFADDVVEQDEDLPDIWIWDPRPVSRVDKHQEKCNPEEWKPNKGTTIQHKDKTATYHSKWGETRSSQGLWHTLWYGTGDEN